MTARSLGPCFIPTGVAVSGEARATEQARATAIANQPRVYTQNRIAGADYVHCVSYRGGACPRVSELVHRLTGVVVMGAYEGTRRSDTISSQALVNIYH